MYKDVNKTTFGDSNKKYNKNPKCKTNKKTSKEA